MKIKLRTEKKDRHGAVLETEQRAVRYSGDVDARVEIDFEMETGEGHQVVIDTQRGGTVIEIYLNGEYMRVNASGDGEGSVDA